MTDIWQMCRQSFVNGKLSEEQIGQLEELPTMMEEILWHLGFHWASIGLPVPEVRPWDPESLPTKVRSALGSRRTMAATC